MMKLLRALLWQNGRLITTALLGLILVSGFVQAAPAQTASNPLKIFKNYFVTGDYVVAGWVEQSSDGSYATGTISLPDPMNPAQVGVSTSVPTGADIVAAFLYWGTVEGNQSMFQGQQGFFNGYKIVGDVLGNPNAPASWSSGGCTGSSGGSKTMRFYRADVRPFLPVDTNPNSATFGAYLPNGPYQVLLADSGKSGNAQPNALGATLVIIYRVLNPPTTLNAVVLYDGSFAPSNNAPNVSQTIGGFYQPTLNPSAKFTHIVANGQPNKGETVRFGSSNNVLQSLYTAIFGASAPPFPGLYGMWDNPTWSVGNLVNGSVPGFDTSETTTIVPASTGSGCVNWGAMILSTTVQDTDGDGLIDAWETPDAQGNRGYVDAISNQWVALPGADPNVKDIFVELDYLVNYQANGITVQHSHLPKQAALDAVAGAFAGQTPTVNVHFDLGPSIYQGDAHVVSYPVSIPNSLPPGVSPPPAGTGGNAIPESALLCSDGATLCAFPGQATVAWKGGFGFVRDNATMPNTIPLAPLGSFQPGRGPSYHYVLSGHALGDPRSFWSAYGAQLGDPTIPQLISIQNTGTTATVKIQTPKVLSPPQPPQAPQGVPVLPKPGDCPNALIPGCSDTNSGRITISGSLTPGAFPAGTSPTSFPLNGTYTFSNPNPVDSVINGVTVTTTTFTITPTSGLPSGTTTYNFSNEPQLAVAYQGPTSSSGHSDFGGGADSAITLGLWGADDVAGCQPDPTQPPGAAGYCNNQVGTTAQQTGTLLHEMGHSLTLTHGGTYYNSPVINGEAAPSFPTYEMNCKPNFLSVMNYLFQVRGFVENKGFDYSGQTMASLNEAYPSLSESAGIGNDVVTGHTADHLTRWYSAPNTIDIQLQNSTGGRYAKAHCDGTPLTSADIANAVRVDGTIPPPGPYSAPLDWNNDLVVPDGVLSPGVDVNYNGLTGDSPFSGFNDWQIVNPTPSSSGVALQQISARSGAFAFSGGGGTKFGTGGGTKFGTGGGLDVDGGSGTKYGTGGGTKFGTGGGTKFGTGGGIGAEQDENTATSTVDAPSGLTCTVPLTGAPACVASTPPLFQVSVRAVPLSWSYPDSTQIRSANLYRALGSFPTTRDVLANFSKFSIIKPFSGSPPQSTYVDTTVTNNKTYTYVLTDKNKQGASSSISTPLVVFVKP